MKYGKWIGGILGWIVFRKPLGAIIGFIIGFLFDARQKPSSETEAREQVQGSSIKNNGFILSLLAVTASVMKADGTVTKGELEYVKQFFISNFGVEIARESMLTLREMVQHTPSHSRAASQIGAHLSYSSRLQVMHYLFGIAAIDGNVSTAELNVVAQIASAMGISPSDYSSIKAMFVVETDSAYDVLEISRNASIDEIKKAYRRMALKYHPDKVTHLGPEFQKAANEKFQKVNEAFEKIKNERGFS